MTIQVITSKDIDNKSIDKAAKYLDETLLEYLTARGWIVDNISII